MEISKVIYDAMRPMPVFKPEMRKANRDGLKSQTRRVMMPQPISTTGFWKGLHWANEQHFRKGAVEHCPYGEDGDFCYMREPMVRGDDYVAYYKDDGVMVRHFLTGEAIPWRWNVKTLSGMFMPKEAARSLYRYESIRVERVQDISEEDAAAEGMEIPFCTHREEYQRLFDKINAKRGFGWDVNPWVWVLGYQPVMYLTPWNVGSEINGLHADFIIMDDPMKDESLDDDARKAFENMVRQNFRDVMNKNIKTIGPFRFNPDEKGGAL